MDVSVSNRLKNGPQYGKNVFIAPNSTILGETYIGDNSSIWYNVTIRADVNKIVIGNNTNIQDHSMIHVTKDKYPTIIGNNVTVGHGVMIHGCTIGNNTLIGIGSIILDGAKIGNNCIVAAGSLIPPRKEYSDNSFIIGHPAVVTRQITAEEILSNTNSSEHYISYKNIYLNLTNNFQL